VKLSGNDLVALHGALEAVANLKGIKFAYGVAKNKSRIETELKALQAGLTPSDKYAEYDKKRLALCRTHAAKDEKGAPQTVGRSFVGLEGNEEFQTKVEALQKEYKDAIDTHQKLLDEYVAAMKEDVEFKEYIIPLANVPEDITAGQLSGIIVLIDDSEKEDDKEVPSN